MERPREVAVPVLEAPRVDFSAAFLHVASRELEEPVVVRGDSEVHGDAAVVVFAAAQMPLAP